MKRFGPIVALVAVCWGMFVVNNLFLGGALTPHGIVPRRIGSLPGILWSPFLHVSFRHLLANTLPLLILGGIICASSRSDFALATVGGIFLGGGLTWLLARNADHVGASGLVFCYFGFLCSRAWFDRTLVSLLIAAVCMVAYGGVLVGLLPTASGISWESHLAGALSGIACAWLAIKKERVQKAAQ